METTLFPDAADQRRFRDFYIRKYQNRQPDIIITVGPSPLRFMLETHQKTFPGVPVIFCLPNGVVPGQAVTDPDFTGVDSDIAAVQTLEVALRLQPRTKHVIVVGGTGSFDKQTEAELEQQLRPYEARLDFSYLTDLALPDLLSRLAHPPDNSVILFTSMSQDATGKRFISASESGPMIAAAANAPLFSLTDVYLNHGEVGGDVSDLAAQGKVAGSMALRILDGEKPLDIPEVTGEFAYIFDWRAFRRWGFNESDLPPGSLVLNRPPSFWKLYWRYVVAGVFLLLAEALIIVGLLWQRRLRREAQSRLEAETEQLQAREELLKIFVKHVPAGVAMLDRDMRYIQVSDRWCADYGVDSSE